MAIDNRKISTFFGPVRCLQRSSRLKEGILFGHFVWKPVWFVRCLSAGLSRWTGWRWTTTCRLMPSSPARISTSRTLTSPTMVLTDAWPRTRWENPTMITSSTCTVSSQSLSNLQPSFHTPSPVLNTRSISLIVITFPFPWDITLCSEHSPIWKHFWYHLQH